MSTRLALPAEGGCQCAAVRYRVEAWPFVSYTCHCRECQQLCASAFATCMQCPAEHVGVTAGTPRRRRRKADSGNVLTVWHCADCGSALYAQSSARPRICTVFVGSLDRAQDVTVDAHIWVSRKLPWVVLPPAHRIFEHAGDWTQDYALEPDRYDP